MSYNLIKILQLATMAYACNFSYLGGRDRRIVIQDQPRQKLVKPYLS
jgi:hypothetical protein